MDQTLFWIGSLSLASAWREEAKSYHENRETFVASKHKRNSAQFPHKFADISIFPDKMKNFPYVKKKVLYLKWNELHYILPELIIQSAPNLVKIRKLDRAS